jgi:hypothetical protein
MGLVQVTFTCCLSSSQLAKQGGLKYKNWKVKDNQEKVNVNGQNQVFIYSYDLVWGKYINIFTKPVTLFLILSHINPVHILPYYFCKTHFKVDLSPMPRTPKCTLFISISGYSFAHMSHLSPPCALLAPSNSSSLI